jgi:hypothetical protein
VVVITAAVFYSNSSLGKIRFVLCFCFTVPHVLCFDAPDVLEALLLLLSARPAVGKFVLVICRLLG